MKSYSNYIENLDADSPASSLIRLFVGYRKWWLVPTLICTLAAIGVAVLSKNQYSSRQTLVVRDDMLGTAFKPGRFESLESMKSAQETILEIARRPQVIRSALDKLGPPRGKRGDWIDDEAIESTQERIKISAPNGAEFGATEAIVLAVEQHTRERSRAFISALLDEIEQSLRQFRASRFHSMGQELAQAEKIADENYSSAASDLKHFEANLGPDLGTLISLGDKQTGSSNSLQNQLSTLVVEQRSAQAEVDTIKKQIQILKDIANDPQQILEVPTELLQLLPTLDSLAKGLNEALLKYSISVSKYSQKHPTVKSDIGAIETVQLQIKQKLADSFGALKYQEELRMGKLKRIEDNIASNRNRLTELSRMRVDYETLRTEVVKKAEVKGKASEKVADIQSLASASNEINMFTRVDEPQVDVHPAGPSKKIVVLGGLLSGLFIGVGLVMLVAPIDNRMFTAFGPTEPLPGGDRETPQSGRSNANASSSFQATRNRAPAFSQRGPITNPVVSGSSPQESDAGKISSGVASTNATAGFTAAQPPMSSTSPSAVAQSAMATSDWPATAGTNPTSSDPSHFARKISKPGLENSIFEELESNKTISIPVAANPETDTGLQGSQAKDSANLPIAEKIRQLDQSELQSAIASQSPQQPIATGGTKQQLAAAVVASTSIQSGTPLKTSKQDSSATEFASASGNQSAPIGGTKPDNRPAASTVDLDRLRKQLALNKAALADGKLQPVELNSTTVAPMGIPASKAQQPPTIRPTPQVPTGKQSSDLKSKLNTTTDTTSYAAGQGTNHSQIEVPGIANKEDSDQPQDDGSLVVDKHISDLADSIRDMCRPIKNQQDSKQKPDSQ